MSKAAGSLRFVRATVDDLTEIRALVNASYTKYVDRIGRRPAPMNADYLAHIVRGQVELARTEAGVVGMIVLIPSDGGLHVSVVAVAPGAQGLGVGTALLAMAADHARALGLSELTLYTNAAMHENLEYYPRRGFTEVDRRSEDGFDRVYFTRRIE